MEYESIIAIKDCINFLNLHQHQNTWNANSLMAKHV